MRVVAFVVFPSLQKDPTLTHPVVVHARDARWIPCKHSVQGRKSIGPGTHARNPSINCGWHGAVWFLSCAWCRGPSQGLPSVRPADFTMEGRPGVRAQLLNAASPAWTSSLAVADYVVERIEASCACWRLAADAIVLAAGQRSAVTKRSRGPRPSTTERSGGHGPFLMSTRPQAGLLRSLPARPLRRSPRHQFRPS